MPRPTSKELRLLKPEEIPQEYEDRLFLIQETASDYLAQGLTQRQVADKIGISKDHLCRLRRKYPAFRAATDIAAKEGSIAILEKIREVAEDTLTGKVDATHARISMEGLAKYLELRWPEKYGKRTVDLNVKTIDMGDALSKARARAQARTGTVIESVAYSTALAAPSTEPNSCDNERLSQISGIDDLL